MFTPVKRGMRRRAEMIIRKMDLSDALEAAQISNECFSRPWTAENFKESLATGLCVAFVAQDEGELTGYITADNVSGEVFIGNVAVRCQSRRSGIGKLLVSSLITECERLNAQYITLEVRVSNEPARALYKKFNFEEQGIRKNFYSAPKEDALIMTRFLRRTTE